MRVHTNLETRLKNTVGHSLRLFAGAALVAGLAVGQAACGDDKKETTTKPGGQTTNPNTNTGTTTPIPDNTGGTGGTTLTEPTSTSVTLSTDGTAAKPTNQVTHAIISYDGKKILGYPYDYCAWLALHSTADAANSKPKKDGEGAHFALDIDVSPGMAPTANTFYTVDPSTTSNNVMYDKNVVGYVQSAGTCTQTSRYANTGRVTWFTVTGSGSSISKITGVIDAGIVGWPDGTTTTLKGSFVAEKCDTSTPGTALTYAADTNACSSINYN